MSANSKIEWTDRTWNPVRGCSLVSAGCQNCYAMRQAHRFSGPGQPYAGLTKMTSHGPVWTGAVNLVPAALEEPLRWNKPVRVFVNSMSDLFHENVTDEFIDSVFAVMALCPQHTFQVLTKRPERMVEYLRQTGIPTRIGMEALAITLNSHQRNSQSTVGRGVELTGDVAHLKVWPLPNVWLGVSVENQETADERIPLLLQTPAAVRWLSCEPLLGPLELRQFRAHNGATPQNHDALTGYSSDTPWGIVRDKLVDRFGRGRVDWVVAGGESGPGARPMHRDWARSLRDQCKAAGVPFLFKQWGAWAPVHYLNLPPRKDDAIHEWLDGDTVIGHSWRVGKKTAGRTLDGITHDEFPK